LGFGAKTQTGGLYPLTDFATMENLDAWLAKAEKNLLQLGKSISEIKRIRATLIETKFTK
jgi:hypothetical protein